MWMWGKPVLDDILVGGYLSLLTVLWALLVYGAPRWGRGHRLLRPSASPPEDAPKVSICIPARDEADCIAGCVRAALATRWPRLEVIVVDDRSSDGTGALARQAAGDDTRFYLSTGTEPPAGWSGKAWACARAASEASGEWLVFVDADVEVDPDAVHAAVSKMQSARIDLLSAFGRWRLESFWEQVAVPPVGWLIRGAVDLDAVNTPGKQAAFANGQFIAVRRATYDRISGHESVADTILDDVRLAAAVQRVGGRLGMYDASWLFEVRPYTGLGEVIAGYSKNLFEGMDRSLTTAMGAVLFIFIGTLMPYLAVAVGLLLRIGLDWGVPGWGWIVWASLVCGLQVWFRARVESRDGRSAKLAWTHALGNALLVWILLQSTLRLEATWKGRHFVDGKAVGDSDGEPTEAA